MTNNSKSRLRWFGFSDTYETMVEIVEDDGHNPISLYREILD